MDTDTTTSGDVEQVPDADIIKLEKKTSPIIKIVISNSSTTSTYAKTTTTTCNTSANIIKIVRTTTAPICSTTISPLSKSNIIVNLNNKVIPPPPPHKTPIYYTVNQMTSASVSNQTPSIPTLPSISNVLNQTTSTLPIQNTVILEPNSSQSSVPVNDFPNSIICFCCSENVINRKRVRMDRLIDKAPLQGKTVRVALESLFLMGQPLFNDPMEEKFRYICRRCHTRLNTIIPRYFNLFPSTSLLGERVVDFRARFEALLLMGKEMGGVLNKNLSTSHKHKQKPQLTFKLLKDSSKRIRTRKLVSSFVGQNISLEAKALGKSQFLRSDVMNQDENNNFFDKLSDEIAIKAPNIAYYLSKIINHKYEPGYKLDKSVLTALCLLLHKRYRSCNKFQRLFSLSIIRNTGNKRVFRILNNLNLTISKDSTERVVKMLESSNPGFHLSKWLNENNFQFSLTGEKGQTVSDHNPSIQIAVVEKVRINDEPLVEVSSGTPTNNDWSSHVSGEMMNMSFLNGEDDDDEEELPDINDFEEDLFSDSPPPTPPSPRKSPRKRKATPKARANALKSKKYS